MRMVPGHDRRGGRGCDGGRGCGGDGGEDGGGGGRVVPEAGAGAAPPRGVAAAVVPGLLVLFGLQLGIRALSRISSRSHCTRRGRGFDLSYQQKFLWDMKF